MKIVLMRGGDYYVDTAPNRFHLKRARLTTDIQEAAIFTIDVVDGELTCCPELPEGDWQIRGVSLTIELSDNTNVHEAR